MIYEASVVVQSLPRPHESSRFVQEDTGGSVGRTPENAWQHCRELEG